MFLSGFAFDHDVINIYLHCAANQRFENLRHQSLISGANVFQSERHDFVTVKTVWHYEGCLFLVSRGHGDLVVSGESVQE